MDALWKPRPRSRRIAATLLIDEGACQSRSSRDTSSQSSRFRTLVVGLPPRRYFSFQMVTRFLQTYRVMRSTPGKKALAASTGRNWKSAASSFGRSHNQLPRKCWTTRTRSFAGVPFVCSSACSLECRTSVAAALLNSPAQTRMAPRVCAK